MSGVVTSRVVSPFLPDPPPCLCCTLLTGSGAGETYPRVRSSYEEDGRRHSLVQDLRPSHTPVGGILLSRYRNGNTFL